MSEESESEEEEEKCEITSESSDGEEQILIKYKIKYNYSTMKSADIINYVARWTPYASKEDIRFENSHKNGGQILPDQETLKTIRNIGKEMIKEIGRKIISGSFNLTTVSFPIKAMVPKSALEIMFQGSKEVFSY